VGRNFLIAESTFRVILADKRIMKVLLIQPPIQDFYQTAIRTQPIGLAYLASSLTSHGHEVRILDCQSEKKKPIAIPPELSYLKDLYPFNDKSPYRLYSGYYHFGMEWKEIEAEIKNSDADIFGISSSFTPYHGEALEVARIIKAWNQRKPVVMGGAHVSSSPEEVLQSPFVDYLVLGEGEMRFPLLLENLERGRSVDDSDGLGYKANGQIRVNPLRSFIEDLDALPFPAREQLELNRYRLKKKRATMIITSRGCPHRCAYCSTHRSMGNHFRSRSPENIIKELRECQERFDIHGFDIEDDNFTYDLKRAKRLMELVIEVFGAHTPEFTAMNGVFYTSLDRELLQLMKKAGFHTINLSLVSTDPSLTYTMGRPKDVSAFESILKEAEPSGLNVIAYAILGMPGQRIEEMVDTLIYLMGKRVLIGPSIYYPAPGTPLFEQCKIDRLLPPHPSQWRSTALPVETEAFNRLDLITLFRLTRVINVIKGKMDDKELAEGITWHEIQQVLKDQSKGGAIISQGNYLHHEDKDGAPTWINLLLALFKERSFVSLHRNSHGIMVMKKVASSKNVLDYFFEKSRGKPILKSRNS